MCQHRETMFQLFFAIIVVQQLISNAVGQSVVSFITQPTDTEVRAGEEGRLQCVLSADASNCFWGKDDQQVTVDGGRYTWTGERTTGDCSIAISGSRFDNDNGMWSCGLPHTSDETGIKSNSAKYTVLEPPKEPLIKVNGIQIENGTEIGMEIGATSPSSVECRSENGNPAASLKWMLASTNVEGNYTSFNDATNLTQTAVLLLTQPVDEGWQGQYLVCVAEHGAYDYPHMAYGIVRSPETTTEVVLTSLVASDDIQVPAEDEITLTCTANGFPAPELKLKNRVSDTDVWSVYAIPDPLTTNAFNYTFKAFDSQFMCDGSNDRDLTVISSNIITVTLASATSSAQVGTIIAIVVVVLVAVVVMGAGVFTCYKKKMCLFKVNNDPVANGGEHGLQPQEMKEPNTNVQSDDRINEEQQKNLMTEENEYNGNMRTDSSPHEKKIDEEILYTQPIFIPQNNQSPLPGSGKTVYATVGIKPK